MKIKSYSKQDLAMLYFPDNDPHTATNHLMRWITNCPPLVEHLRKTHYRRNSKYFIAHQVRVMRDPCAKKYSLNSCDSCSKKNLV